jgi:hypothetical protein
VLGVLVRPDSVAAFTVNVTVLVTPKVAVITTEVFAMTGLVVIVNVAEVAPEGTVTAAGTCATFVLLLDRATEAPPAGAGPLSVTVPVELAPPTTVAGVRVKVDRVTGVGAFTVRVAVRVTPNVAEMMTEVFAATGLVVIGNVADVAPAGTVIFAPT